jgi:hypothetical protein
MGWREEMSTMHSVERPTKPLGPPIQGNYMFARAAYSLGVDIMTARRLLAEALRTRNVLPLNAEHDDVFSVMPVLELILERTFGRSIALQALTGLRSHLAET